MVTIKKIKWSFGAILGLDWLKPEYDDKTNSGIERSSFGFLSAKECWFEIRRTGKKKPIYSLFTYPIRNGFFTKLNTKLNNSKKIGEYNSPEEASNVAKSIIEELVESLIN